jgi:DNA-binding beta-propeller fold protein YncE
MLASAAQIVMPAHAQQPAVTQTATGQLITPTAIPGAVQQDLNPGLADHPNFAADEAVRSQLSPDGTTLAIITAGYNELSNLNAAGTGTVTVDHTQYIFIYNVAGKNKTKPVLQKVIQQANAHVGLVFSPDGKTLYAAGGEDDAVYAYTSANWSQSAKIALGHNGKGLGLGVGTNASGLGISADGKTLVVANNYNDSISVIDTATNTVRFEHDLRPFATGNEGVAGGVGGTFPLAVAVNGNTVYVSSDRDREVVVIDISASPGLLIKRIVLDGNGQGMTLDKSGSTLYVAQDNADQIAVIDTKKNVIIEKIDTRAPEGVLNNGVEGGDRHTGAATFSSTISPDGKTLYAVNSGANSIAVIPLHGNGAHKVKALIPTAYEPRDITFSADGSWMYIINGKSVTGPNPANLATNQSGLTAAQKAAVGAANEYQFRLERSSLVSAPVPGNNDLQKLTQQVAQNNFYKGPSSEDAHVMAFLREHIKHVIYVIKENRTFDQILGDLKNGANADPSLTQFGAAITPNFHNLAQQFVTLDNFTDPGDGSMDGWSYALQGRVTNTETISQHVNYGGHGLSYESEGSNRNAPVNWPTVAERDAAGGVAGTTNYSNASAGLPGGTVNLLTGDGDHAASDAPFGEQEGYIFDAVLRAGLTVRNYGALVNNIGSIGTPANPVMNPFAQNVIQVAPLKPSLAPFTDVYFRGFDQNYPDLWRYNEWKREFDQFVQGRNLPNLSIVRISHDHMGFGSGVLAGLTTPELQQADDDLSAGLLVQAVANSPYASDTVIFFTEDDAQDGADHVDSHRTTTYVVGPYVRKGEVVKTHYSQVSVLRTIEDLLGTQHINLNTAFQRPMSDVFNIRSFPAWTYTVTASTVLLPVQNSLKIQLAMGDQPVKFAEGPIVKSKHNGEYWMKVTKGMNFAVADRLPARFNQIIWKGMMGNKPYPKMVMDMYHKVDDDD